MQGWTDPLTRPPRRIAVAGVSGAGKTTAARRIAALVDARHTEIDSLFHGPGWTPRPSFVADVTDVVDGDAWVIEWQYGATRDLIADRCDVLVWLDFPFWRVSFPRLVRRTVRRRVRREVLWNGNVEGRFRAVVVDRDHILRWAVRNRRFLRDLVPEVAHQRPDLTVVRIRTPKHLDAWIGGPLTASQR